MTLGKVVYGLSETTTSGGAKKHVPYRDSKLTRLLQPSLSGNAQVVLVCCISPLVSHTEESHNTFKFAIRAKKIPQKAVIDETGASGDNGTMLQTYRDEIEDLKQQLREAQRLLQMTNQASSSSSAGLSQQQRQTMTMTTMMTSATATTSSAAAPSTADVEEEMLELVTAIRNMEKLILKTKSSAEKSKKNDDNEDEDDLLGLDDEELQQQLETRSAVPSQDGSDDGNYDYQDRMRIATTTTSPTVMTTPPPVVAADHLQSELSRIQSLLGTVLQKRYSHDETVRNLRAQLEEQEVTGTLRQADSSFLQKQLAEKDALLEEVSRLLETVEEKQSRLEAENASLRQELARYNQKQSPHGGNHHYR
jgi:Kinesin motor domain